MTLKFLWRSEEIAAYEAEKKAKELEKHGPPKEFDWGMFFELFPLALTVIGTGTLVYIAYHFIHKYW
jgi:hypothetical protein